MNTTYRFDDQAIVYEIIGNEAVLVNLDSGYYYILDNIATLIWLAMRDGATVDEEVRSLHATYDAPIETIQQGVKELLSELVLEGIFHTESSNTLDTSDKSSQESVPVAGARAFYKPTFSKFKDMKYVIPMDPVWDFDETGWPIRRTNPAESKK